MTSSRLFESLGFGIPRVVFNQFSLTTRHCCVHDYDWINNGHCNEGNIFSLIIATLIIPQIVAGPSMNILPLLNMPLTSFMTTIGVFTLAIYSRLATSSHEDYDFLVQHS